MGQTEMTLDKEIVQKIYLKYLLYLPKDYDPHSEKRWPLILFLHGAGERGNDLEIVKRNGIPKIAEQENNLPFIAVSPQCPENSVWEDHFTALDILLEEIAQKYKIDEDRLYLTGLSMGGYGTWDLAMMFPERFAGIVPICGGSAYPHSVELLTNLPIWVFHGAKDDIVPVEESQVLVNALTKLGSNVRFTVYPEAGHDSWTETYNNPELYAWLLRQKRDQ